MDTKVTNCTSLFDQAKTQIETIKYRSIFDTSSLPQTRFDEVAAALIQLAQTLHASPAFKNNDTWIDFERNLKTSIELFSALQRQINEKSLDVSSLSTQANQNAVLQASLYFGTSPEVINHKDFDAFPQLSQIERTRLSKVVKAAMSLLDALHSLLQVNQPNT